MNDQTLQALAALAQKLGTTAEFLWVVLLKQAPITAAVNIAVMTACVTAVVFVFRLVRRKTTPPPATDAGRYPRPCAEWTEEGAFLAWAGAVLLAVITMCR